jgi:hypothetical protein
VLRVTIDTNVYDRDTRARLDKAINGLEVDVAPTTVTLRERPETRGDESSSEAVYETGVWDESIWDEAVYAATPIYETAVLDESRLDRAVLGGEESGPTLEAILRIIGSGSFPKAGEREKLTDGQRHQLRDAMILEAHTREGRDVLVSNDVKAFGRAGDERRTKLERLCKTRILTVDEFCEQVASLCDPS